MTTVALPVFSPNAQALLCERYYHQGEAHNICVDCGKYHEDQNQFIDRISLGNADWREMIQRLDFLPNSPTLFNLPCSICGETAVSGTCSACFKFDVQDTMISILDVQKKAGLVLKAGGGVGFVLSEVRAEGEPVNSTHRKALGPLGVLRMYHQTAKEITQGGRRDGAQMGILSCDHPDVLKFIHMKDDNPDAMSTFNLSVACTDGFMEDVQAGRAPAIGLWKEMQMSAWTSGDPGVYFIDTANRWNPTPWLGRLTGTNPCGEVPLLDDEACNLGSINLGHFVAMGGEVKWEELEETTRQATRYLDTILDLNEFPDPEITEAVRLTRKLGLGPMGWADMLALLSIPYGSNKALELGIEVMENINTWSHRESNLLGDTKGVAPCFTNAVNLPDGGVPAHRNATLTCIAPTGTISILAGCSSGIEPHFALKWQRKTGSGMVLQEQVPVLDRLNGFTPQVAHEIPWEYHVKHQAVFQRHTDLAVSKTINMPADATPNQIGDAYLAMWRSGCKGGTVYRDGSREGQVLVEEAAASKEEDDPHIVHSGAPASTSPTSFSPPEQGPLTALPSTRLKLPAERQAITHRFQVGEQEGYITAGRYPNGQVGELFINVSQQGSTVRGLLDGVGILTSIALQYGVPLEVITRKMRGMSFEPAGMTWTPGIPKATSILDYIAHWLELRFLESDQVEQESQVHGEKMNGNGDCCPACGAAIVRSEGCEQCSHQCGWTRC